MKREEARGARRPLNSGVLFLTSFPGATLSRYHVTEPMASLPRLALKEQGKKAVTPSWVWISWGWDTQRAQDPGSKEKTQRNASPVTPERKDKRACSRISQLSPYPRRVRRISTLGASLNPFLFTNLISYHCFLNYFSNQIFSYTNSHPNPLSSFLSCIHQ